MTLTNLDIKQLVILCKKGDQRAQLELYNRYYHAMYNTAYRIVKDSFEAEDIMQESFIKAFNKLDNLRDEQLFGAWLKRIVTNRAIYQFNNSRSHDEIAIDDVMYKLEDDKAEDTSVEFTAMKAQAVLSCMDQLKDNYRMVLTLHLIEGYDYDEITEIMNISYNNCRTLISRAKDKLRTELLQKQTYLS